MPPATVFYAFSFHSPYSALADSRIDGIIERAGCRLEPLPLVPPIPPEPEGVQALVARLRADYIVEDSARWASSLGVPWNPTPPPVLFGAAVAASAAWFHARAQGEEQAFRNAVFRARFGAGANTEDPATLGSCAREAGLDPEALVEASRSRAFTSLGPAELPRMAKEGVFGVPFFSFDGQRFFGNDRLELLEAALGTSDAR